jgi:hypothetical protein
MSDRTERILGLVFSVFAIASTVVQLLALNHAWQRYSAFVVAGVFAILAWIFLYRGNAHHQAVSSLVSLIGKKNRPMEAKLVSSKAEVKEVWHLDKKCFGCHTVSANTGIMWWENFRHGLIALRRNYQLVGYVSFWPLTSSAFNEFLDGNLLEHQIGVRHIEKAPEKRCWYIGSILIKSDFRRSAIKHLLQGIETHWIKTLPPEGEIQVCALAFSSEGEKLLSGTGFSLWESKDESRHHFSVYSMQTSQKELLDMIGNLIPKPAKMVVDANS